MIGLLNAWAASFAAIGQPKAFTSTINTVAHGITGFVAYAIAGFGLVYVVESALMHTMIVPPMATQVLWGLYGWTILFAYIPRILSTINRSVRPYTTYLYNFVIYFLTLILFGGIGLSLVMAPLAMKYGFAAMGTMPAFKISLFIMITIANSWASMVACALTDRKKGVEDAVKVGLKVLITELPYLLTTLAVFAPLGLYLVWFATNSVQNGGTFEFSRVNALVSAVWQLATWMLWATVYSARKGSGGKAAATRAKKRPMKRVKK